MAKVVMVVDDSTTTRKFLMFALRSQGFQVVTAQDGLDALEKMAHADIDLLITDLNMPKLDGYSLVKAVREDHTHGALPIIILSSMHEQGDIDRGLQLGANAFVVKPLNEQQIQQEVAKLLN
jgi:two-component system chemotaxis response regulator CheY